ncbi:histidine phosphatase family protein [Legionella sp. PC997]|uniref:histidine phosphatase family protein n=1 Tax=Legionella sp. PC997 TaxID=2755562 RepID=UPI0015FA9733|nr:histidine phosphatase family protein [Legionella sp. PC997]QMT61740.1 hypothetical protein HBNCFIEN_03146 [Legionella sp. PC997]
MSKLTLWLIRHGETFVNIRQWTDKPNNSDLTPLGIQQACTVAKEIKRAPDLIIRSPLQRVLRTAEPIIKLWPQTPVEIWPIEEFAYLSPIKLKNMDSAERKKRIEWYWQEANPLFCDGEQVEAFAHFIERVQSFYEKLSLRTGFIVVIGHGVFFRAFQFGLEHGWEVTPQWMQQFRQFETSNPLKNCEIIKFDLQSKGHESSLNSGIE